MKPLWICFMLALSMMTSRAWAADDFKPLWYDGNAEISVYDLKENRYNDIRKGQRILVFVTEPLERKTLIKPDNPLPEDKRYDVIKLNDIRKFTTGIYDYSTMISVFSAVGSYDGIPAMGVLKTTFTGQEWCGNVFEIMKRTEKGFHIKLYSYFESDGEPETLFPAKENLIAEDNLWILVRELKGPFLKTGESETFQLIPSSWQRRKRHVPINMETVVVSKANGGRVSTPAGYFPSTKFQWVYDNRTTTVWVERAWPHKIITWTEPDGSKGELISSSRKPYWQLHDNKDHWLRKKLHID